jgi:hypothetical protein
MLILMLCQKLVEGTVVEGVVYGTEGGGGLNEESVLSRCTT